MPLEVSLSFLQRLLSMADVLGMGIVPPRILNVFQGKNKSYFKFFISFCYVKPFLLKALSSFAL
jgi:hypothetical protein